jgi:CO/xanthine dehydrogenase Mo-binding subunit
MATVASDRLFGKSIKRREDPRFITGRGQYVDDLKLPGMTYAAFVRSPHAHAKIRKIDTARGRAPSRCRRGLHRQGHDRRQLAALRLGPPQGEEVPGVMQDLAIVPHMPLTSDAARHVGDPVAIVIADSHEAAVDGAEKVQVDWEPLPSVTITDKAAGVRSAQAPRRRAGQRRVQVGDRRSGGDRRRLQQRAGQGEEAHRQPAPGRQRHGAARVRGPLRRRDRRADALGNLAEPARASPLDVRVRPRHSRAQGPGDRTGRGRRLRLEDLSLQRGSRLLLGVAQAEAPGAVDGEP